MVAVAELKTMTAVECSPKEVVQTFAVQVEQSSAVAVETQKPPGLHFESSRNSLPL